VATPTTPVGEAATGSATRRQLTYAQAINEALSQAMEMSPDVFVMGQLVDYRSGVFGTTAGLADKFGPDRVRDFPVAESLMTSAAIGAAVAGMRPVIVHTRLDFMMYSMDAIVNWLALWRFKSSGEAGLPVTIRAIVGKGWGQGPQHSKSPHAWFAHLPGLRVATPATAYDAKGLILESIFGEDPAIIIESRSLFSMVDAVPEDPYRVRFGRAMTRRTGNDVTLVTLGSMVPIALRAAQRLSAEGISVEAIDLRTVSPIDLDAVLRSVERTRRLVVADPAWHSVGVAAEVIASVVERLGSSLLANPTRVTYPDSHTPMSAALEAHFYPDEEQVMAALRGVCES
jgi:pyruvate/2-oxoglutarate/acetoin dehydrogenase E1 component